MPKKRPGPAARGPRGFQRNGPRKHRRPAPTKVSPSVEAELQRPAKSKPSTNGPVGQDVAIHLSPQLIDSLWKIAEKQGKPYLTVIHELLEQAAGREGRSQKAEG